jgi:DNA-binding PadR family transcriptional regulator
MELKPVSFLCLGMVRFGATSGYAIKKAADAATNAIWPTSLAQVYPELARLEKAGLLARRDDPQGGRARAAYELTTPGYEALLVWLRAPTETLPQVRYEAILRAFFGDALPLEDQVLGLRQQREHMLFVKAHLFDGDLRTAARAIDAGEMRYPLVLGDFAEDFLDFIHEWIGGLVVRLEKELAESPPQAEPPEPPGSARPEVSTKPVKLRTISYLILGMVRFGINSGYAIKRGADAGINYIWPVSLAQVYPELAKLEGAGLLIKHSDPRGARARDAYELTKGGEEALLAWLRAPVVAPPRMRHEGLLRVFFSDALPLADQLEALRSQRQLLHALRDHLFTGDLTAAGRAIEAGGMRFPIYLAECGVAALAFVDDWLGRFEATLEEELAAAAAKEPRS